MFENAARDALEPLGRELQLVRPIAAQSREFVGCPAEINDANTVRVLRSCDADFDP